MPLLADESFEPAAVRAENESLPYIGDLPLHGHRRLRPRTPRALEQHRQEYRFASSCRDITGNETFCYLSCLIVSPFPLSGPMQGYRGHHIYALPATRRQSRPHPEQAAHTDTEACIARVFHGKRKFPVRRYIVVMEKRKHPCIRTVPKVSKRNIRAAAEANVLFGRQQPLSADYAIARKDQIQQIRQNAIIKKHLQSRRGATTCAKNLL